MPAQGLFRGIALMPLLAPSLLSAISLIYWFGNQGIAQGRCCGGSRSTARPASSSPRCFYCFPHALMILVTALSLADARLYEAADALGTRRCARSSRSRCPAPSTA